MRLLTFLILLVGPSLACATELTGRELALLRVILKQDMQSDVRAAVAEPNYVDANDVAPLETALGRCPDADDLHAVMADEANSPFRRFNAARGLAFIGDERCLEILSRTLAGDFAMSSSGFEQSKAALCLLQLEYDFSPHFLFTHLPNPLYPELNVLLDSPADYVSLGPRYTARYDDPNAPYSKSEIVAAVEAYMDPWYTIDVRGPLTVLDVEQRELQFDLETACMFDREVDRNWFTCWDGWLNFKDEIRSGDLMYYFISDEFSWACLCGCEGYVLIRDGQVAHFLIAGLN